MPVNKAHACGTYRWGWVGPSILWSDNTPSPKLTSSTTKYSTFKIHRWTWPGYRKRIGLDDDDVVLPLSDLRIETITAIRMKRKKNRTCGISSRKFAKHESFRTDSQSLKDELFPSGVPQIQFHLFPSRTIMADIFISNSTSNYNFMHVFESCSIYTTHKLSIGCTCNKKESKENKMVREWWACWITFSKFILYFCSLRMQTLGVCC